MSKKERFILISVFVVLFITSIVSAKLLSRTPKEKEVKKKETTLQSMVSEEDTSQALDEAEENIAKKELESYFNSEEQSQNDEDVLANYLIKETNKKLKNSKSSQTYQSMKEGGKTQEEIFKEVIPDLFSLYQEDEANILGKSSLKEAPKVVREVLYQEALIKASQFEFEEAFNLIQEKAKEYRFYYPENLKIGDLSADLGLIVSTSDMKEVDKKITFMSDFRDPALFTIRMLMFGAEANQDYIIDKSSRCIEIPKKISYQSVEEVSIENSEWTQQLKDLHPNYEAIKKMFNVKLIIDNEEISVCVIQYFDRSFDIFHITGTGSMTYEDYQCSSDFVF